MKKYIYLLLLVVCGCAQVKTPSAKVSIHVPSMEEIRKKLGQPIRASEDWDSNDPQAVTDFNCFAIMVSGPEADMRRNTCSRADGSIAPFPVGRWAGGIPTGSDITIEVPAGIDRVVGIVGFKAQTGACGDFKTGNMAKSKLTKPTRLGEIGGVNLQPGMTTTVTVDIAYNGTDNTKWFDECNGPDFNGQGGQPTVPATDFSARTSATYAGVGTCHELNLNLTSGQNYNVSNAAARTFGIVDGISGANFFTSLTACQSNTGSISSYTLSAGSTKATLYYRPTSAGPRQITLTTTDFGSNLSHTTFLNAATVSAPSTISANQNEILIPIGQCRDVYVFSYSGSYTSKVSSDETITLNYGTATGVLLTSDCSSSTSISSITIPNGQAFAKFAIKSIGAITNETLTLTPSSLGSAYQITMNPPPLAHHLDLSFDVPYTPHFTECIPMKLTALDAFNAATIIPSPGPSLNLNVDGKNGSQVSNNSACNTPQNTINVFISNPSSSTSFYMTGMSPSQTQTVAEFNPYQSSRISSPLVSTSHVARTLLADPYNMGISMYQWYHMNNTNSFASNTWSGIDSSRASVSTNCGTCPAVSGGAIMYGNRDAYPLIFSAAYSAFSINSLSFSGFSSIALMKVTNTSNAVFFSITGAGGAPVVASNTSLGDAAFSGSGYTGLTPGYRMIGVHRIPDGTDTLYSITVGAGDPSTASRQTIAGTTASTTAITLGANTAPLTGELLEWVVTNNIMTLSQMQQLKYYFEQKYQMTLETR